MTAILLDVHGFGGMESMAQSASGALAAAVWQGIAIAVAVALGLRLFPKMPATARFAIWASAFAVIAVLPLLHRSMENNSSDAVNVLGEHARAVWTLDARWSLALVGLWAATSLVRVVSLLIGAVKLRGLWKRATPLEVSLPGAAVRNVRVCTSDEVDRPGVIGFFAPKIVIPAWLFEKLTAPEIEQIVLHEIGHLRRADDWINLLQKVALTIFPLNPALLWVERKLCFERELACDDAVLHLTRSPREYATCLTTIAEHRMRLNQARRGLMQPLGALSLGALGRQSELGQRVESILRRSDRMSVGQARFAMAVAVAGLLGGAAELSQCRELVSFTGAPVAMALGNAPVAGATGRLGSMYQAASFRPTERAHETLLKARMPATTATPIRQNTAAAIRVPPADTVTNAGSSFVRANRVADRVQDVVARDRDMRGAQRSSPEAAGQWLVVTTTWRGPDGSRMVLTTAELPEPAASSHATEEVAPVAAFTQVYPYAAVPTRDGWLVFQL
jgi:beta-lactamase regulating signal transducer with metallopeptidase domain